MKHFVRMIMAGLAVLLVAGVAPAQQKTDREPSQVTPLRVEIVLTEYDGAKKMSSLPYTLNVNAVHPHGPFSGRTYIRLGVRVPVATGTASSNSATQFEYMDTGTNIDCTAQPLADSAFGLDLSIDRSSLYLSPGGKDLSGAQTASGNPMVRRFQVGQTLLLKDGQSDESIVATDPVSGHILRVSVTLHVLKGS